MIERTNTINRLRVLVVNELLDSTRTIRGRAIRSLVEEIEALDLEVVEALSFADGQVVVENDASLSAVLVDWTADHENAGEARKLLSAIRRRNLRLPVVLMADRAQDHQIEVNDLSQANEFFWLLQDSAPFLAGRVVAAVKRYRDNLLPPFNRALLKYMEVEEYSWAAPGHQGGVAFTKSAPGRVFYDFFGENLFRTDSGIERSPLGSLLDHEGPLGEAETYAAQVFGAHRTYNVLNGTSASNRTIMTAVLRDGSIALCDRNCHKSIEQGLIQSGAIPTFLLPTRNRYGIIGPIPPVEYDSKEIKAKLATHPLKNLFRTESPDYAVVTNCTYDGMCVHAANVQELLAASTDRIHFDEAWFAYARFHPLYENRHAMRGAPADHPSDAPTVFATHSTHKLLAALSQSSFIHVRNGRNPIEHSRFNEAYCAQATTSPLYAMAASNEMGAAMMDGPAGKALLDEVILEAIHFRKALGRAHATFAKNGDWFFEPWNAPIVKDPRSGKEYPFTEAPDELLATEPSCWTLKPEEEWHGFKGLPEDWCLLDPVKPGILSPGMNMDGRMAAKGVPAAVVSSYLEARGIIPSRTTDFMILPLFSIGVTKGKWGSLVNALLNFKEDYDANLRLEHVLPKLVDADPGVYGPMGLRDLGEKMFSHMKENRIDRWQAEAFASLPRPDLAPREAYFQLQEGAADLLPLAEAAGRTAGVGLIPYPPGIPIVMPGENLGEADGPWISYLLALEESGRSFPGFEKVVEGAEIRDGKYNVWCLR
ncbi:MAG: Orn/Lys/Arg decarboxylase N-terminal domain-containing protein [Verrucomicrobiota bacterium]